MQENKTFKRMLIKILSIICSFCCCFALCFGLVGCSEEQVITGIRIDADGNLYVTYNNSEEEVKIENVKGPQGETGPSGAAGQDGVSVTNVEINAAGELIISFSKGEPVNLGKVTGADGAPGQDANLFTCEECDLVSTTLKYPTCCEEGLDIVACTVCQGVQAVKTAVDPEMHGTRAVEEEEIVPGYWISAVEFTQYDIIDGEGNYEPTCTEAGYWHKICSGCGETLIDEEIPALDHMDENGDTTYIHFAGPLKDGNVCMDGWFDGYVCTLCNDVYDKASEGIVVGDTIVDRAGLRDAKYTPARGYHTADNSWTYVDGKKPTLTESTQIEGVCTLCGTTQRRNVPALTDEIYTKITVTPAGCKDKGLDRYTANVAGFDVEVEIVTSVKHVLGGVDMDLDKTYSYAEVQALGLDIIGNVPSTCEDPGEATFTCDVCHGHYKVNYKANHEKADAGVVTAPTCTAQGYTTFTCKVCGETWKENYTAIIDHNYVKISENVNATNPAEMDIVFECTMCKATLPVTGTKDDAASYEATCQGPGKTVYNAVDPNGDPIVVEVTHAQLTNHTISGQEFEDYKARPNGYRYSDIAALVTAGKINYIDNVDVSCTVPGEATFFCDVCSAQIKIIVYADHDLGEAVVVEPDCVNGGYQYQVCADCGEEVKVPGSETPALGHTWVEDESKRVDNNNGTYSLTFDCSVCDETLVIPNATLSTDPLKTFDPTCKDKGQKTYTYTDPNTGAPAEFVIYIDELEDHAIAGEIYQDYKARPEGYRYSEIAALVATGDINYIDNVDVSCEVPGEATFFCDDCGKQIKIIVYADHDLGQIFTVNPDCENGGYQYQVCADCGEEFVVAGSETPALGHSYGAPEIVIIEGIEKVKFVCTVCGDELIDIPWDIIVVNPTCTSNGYTTYVIDVDGDNTPETVYDPDDIVIIGEETEALGHDYEGAVEFTFQVEIGGVLYNCKAVRCNECGEALIIEKVVAA